MKKAADDNLHILLWLLKDISWMMKWKVFGMIMILPTLTMAILILLKNDKSHLERLPDLSVLLWITANSIWMVSEFYDYGIEKIAAFFFVSGLISIVFYFSKKYKIL